MYKCNNCWNEKEFIENYTDSVYVCISKWKLCYSKSDPQLMEVVCTKCNNSTEDGDILIDWTIFII